MMKETGIILKTDGSEAIVSVKRKSSCGESCAMCKGVCSVPSIEVLATNNIGATEGDLVILESETKAVLKGALFVYIVPVLLMFTAYLLSSSFIEKAGAVLIISILAFLSGCIIIKLFDKRIAPKTYITEILDYSLSDKEV